jgi:ribosome-associated toxin RatA of RatAB toxin-antitoxin module
MRDIRRNALVPYAPEEMYALVNDVAGYPAFVPWCRAARVLTSSERELTATLEIARAGLKLALTTRNALTPGERIEMTLADGPFAHFSGRWDFVAIRDAAGAVRGCRIELLVRFEFRNAALGLLAAPLFERSWDSLVDAFVRRARELHGG